MWVGWHPPTLHTPVCADHRYMIYPDGQTILYSLRIEPFAVLFWALGIVPTYILKQLTHPAGLASNNRGTGRAGVSWVQFERRSVSPLPFPHLAVLFIYGVDLPAFFFLLSHTSSNSFWRTNTTFLSFVYGWLPVFRFQVGPLDQGYWPDGLLTAPSEEALLYDLQVRTNRGCGHLSHLVDPILYRRWSFPVERCHLTFFLKRQR